MAMGSILELFSGKKACRLLVRAEGEVMEKYQRFREFLRHNHDALNLGAELEALLRQQPLPHGGGEADIL
jgi:hexokinase